MEYLFGWIIKTEEREAFAAYLRAVPGDVRLKVEEDESLTIRPADGQGTFALNLEPVRHGAAAPIKREDEQHGE